MNTKETLKRLHKKFPMMGLDELFEVLDCYVEESAPKIWCATNGVESNKISCSKSNKSDIKYDGTITTVADFGSLQLTASH